MNEAFSAIYVGSVECGVRILPAGDGMCRAVCPENRSGGVYHTVTVEEGTLRIERHDDRKWYQRIGVSFGPGDVTVYLPEKTYERLEVLSVSGDVRVSDGFDFGSVRLESTSGSIRMASGAQEKLEAETASGTIAIENASPETLEVKSISGGIELAHIRSGEITARATSGRIELDDVIAEKTLSVRNTSGSVAMDGCDAGSIKIKNVSGSVKGTILSEKIFITDTTSGSVKVPRSASGGECEITTTSGSIAIEIRP